MSCVSFISRLPKSNMLALRCGNINTTATKACVSSCSSTRWLHHQQQQQQQQSLQRVSPTQQESASSSSWGQNLTALAATALGLGGSAAMVAACEKSQHDPMTKYANATSTSTSTSTPQTTTPKVATIATSATSATSTNNINNTNNNTNNNDIQAMSPDILANNATSNSENDQTADEKRLEEAALRAKKHAGGLKIFSGNGNMALSMEIAKTLGINLGKATVG